MKVGSGGVGSPPGGWWLHQKLALVIKARTTITIIIAIAIVVVVVVAVAATIEQYTAQITTTETA